MPCDRSDVQCKLGTLECTSICIPGNSAANIAQSQAAECKSCVDLPVLGPGQYDLLVIGDQPYIEDDRRNIPFQDNSSNLIIEFMKKAGIDLSRVYMTKITKCKPRKIKRRATIQEINTCRDEHLRKEIELIQPKAVVLVGAQALKAFNLTGRGSLNSIRGRVFEEKFTGWDESPVFKIIPTLNPGQFFYKPNPKLRNRVQHDYVVAKNVIDGVEPSDHFTPLNWHLIDTPEKLEWLVQEIEQTTLFSFDTESAHLGFMRAPLLCFSFAWGWDQCAVLPILKHDPNAPEEQIYHTLPAFGDEQNKLVSDALKRIFETPHMAKAAHNFKYDYNVSRWNYGIKPQGFLIDTMVQKHLMDENPPSSLEFLCDLEFAWGDYGAPVRQIAGQGKELRNTYDKVPDAILWPYTATDALGTYRLACTYTQRLKKRPNLWTFYQEESEPLIRALAKAEFKGALIDLDVLESLKAEYEAEQKNLLTTMRAALWPDFNPSSNPQVRKAFKNLGVPNIELEDENAASGYSANKNKLTELIEKGVEPAASFSEQLLTYRNRSKLISTYLVNAKKDLDPDGRLRYTWFSAGTVTGRLSCRFFHQLPKIDEARVAASKSVMRNMMIVPKGYSYIYADYSQIELYILAILSADKELLRILYNGGDLHKTTAFEFLSPVWPGLKESAVNKFNRVEVGKKINFGLSYGSKGFSLVKVGKWMDAKGVERNFTWDFLNQGMLRWKARFTGVGTFTDQMPDVVRSYGCIATNVFGRERHIGPALNHSNNSERGRAERETINFFIQAPATSITNRTIVEVDKVLESYNVSEDCVCLINTVHDSLAYEVRDDFVEWFTTALRQIASRPIPQLNNTQFKVDIGIGKSWCEAEMNA